MLFRSAGGSADALQTAQPLSPNRLVLRRFLRHRAAVFGALGASMVVLFIIIGSLLVPLDKATRPDVARKLTGPSAQNFFGTDTTGRDIFARIVYGGQISLMVAALSLAIGVGVGVVIGAAAGFFGGWVDAVLMRITEAMLSIPQLFLLIVLGKLLGSKLPNILFFGRMVSGSVIVVILVIGLTSWMYEARIIRANILSLRERDYVSAARALGAGDLSIMLRHLIPNTIAPIIVSATLGLVPHGPVRRGRWRARTPAWIGSIS